MRPILALWILLGLATPVMAGAFARKDCHVRFDVPRGWKVTVDKEESGKICTIALEPRNLRQLIDQNNGVDLYGVLVEVYDGSLEAVLPEDGSFVKEDGQWYVLGRQGLRSEAHEIKSAEWSGLRGTSESGCHYEEGGYAGLCPVEVALISNGRSTASIVAGPNSHADFDSVLKKFRFE